MLRFALKLPESNWPTVDTKVEIKTDPAAQAWALCEHSNGTVAEVLQGTDALAPGELAEIGDSGIVTSIFAVTTARGATIGMVEMEPEV